MFNALIEITFFNFPELSKTLTSCIKWPFLNLIDSKGNGKKKATPKGERRYLKIPSCIFSLSSIGNGGEVAIRILWLVHIARQFGLIKINLHRELKIETAENIEYCWLMLIMKGVFLIPWQTPQHGHPCQRFAKPNIMDMYTMVPDPQSALDYLLVR